jgi:hypothetical protein
MATRAERFRYEAERSKPNKAPRPPRPPKRRDTTDDGARNLSLAAGKKAGVVTEESHTGHASRKSGRASAHHGKNSTVLEYVARVRSAQPQARHARRS